MNARLARPTGPHECAAATSNLQPQVQHSLEVLDNLVPTELALAVETVDESDRALGHLVAHSLRTNHHLHLEAVTLALRASDDLFQDRLLVQPEATSQVANARHEHHVRDEVSGARGELPEQVPAVHATLDISAARVTGSTDDVGVGLFLDLDHLGDELGMVAEIGVHDDNEVASAVGQAVDVGSAEAKFALTGLEVDVLGAVESLELLSDLEGAVRGAVVDNHDFPVQVTAGNFSMSVDVCL